jgi:hypothetical protein
LLPLCTPNRSLVFVSDPHIIHISDIETRCSSVKDKDECFFLKKV